MIDYQATVPDTSKYYDRHRLARLAISRKAFRAAAIVGMVLAATCTWTSVTNAQSETMLSTYHIPTCAIGDKPAIPSAIQRTVHGGLSYTYLDDGGGYLVATVPPAGFQPLLADNETLAEMGLPARPSTADGLTDWKSTVGQYKIFAPAQYCVGPEHNPTAIATPSALSTAQADAGAPWAAHRMLSNWSGFQYTNSNFTGAVSHWIQNGAADCYCSNPYEYTWVGLGGDPGGLIQAGTRDIPNVPNQAFYEYVTSCGSIGPYINGPTIPTGQDVAAAVTWDGTSGTMQVAFNGTLAVSGTYHPALGGACIQNSKAEFINERPTGTDLTNYRRTDWSSARVNIGSSVYGISSLTALAIVMSDNTNVDATNCTNSYVVAFPSNLANNAFSSYWCHA